MGAGLAFLLFLFLALGWILLAFLPGLREMRRHAGAGPLPVRRDARVDIRHFARTFGEYVAGSFGELLARCEAEDRPLSGELDGGVAYVVVPGRAPEPPLASDDPAFCERLIVAAGGLRLPPDFVHAAEIQAKGDVAGGERSVYRAVLAGGSLDLAPGSASLRWLHAGRDLRAAEGCLLHGRVSADRTLRLAAGCRFERLYAPVVDFGAEGEAQRAARAPDRAGAQDARPLDPEQVPRLKDTRGGRWIVDREFELEAGRLLTVDVVVRGNVILRAGARVDSSLKSRRAMMLERGVTVAGSLVSEQDLVVGEDCRVGGPIVCEGTLTLRRGSVVGAADRPTSVSARRILVEPGVRCHGTVWAHERGDVLAPVDAAAQQEEVSA